METQIEETQKSLEGKLESLKKSESNTKWIFVGLFAVVVILWLVSWWLLMGNKTLTSWEHKAAFGDMFGAVNSLFSGLALVGIVVAIFMQRIEIRYQRIELEYQRLELIQTRLELKRSASAQEKSEQALSEQVRQMRVTAQINAMSARLQCYSQVLYIPSQHLNAIPGAQGKDWYSDAIKNFISTQEAIDALLADIEYKKNNEKE